MNKLFKLKSIFLLAITAMFITSCGEDNESIFTNTDDPIENDAILSVFEGGGDDRSITVTDFENGTATVRIQFKSQTNAMRRLYVTQNVSGFGAEPYDLSAAGVIVDNKADGSLDLDGQSDESFDFTVDFIAPSSDDSNIVYTLWTTTGRGDFRDIEKRNAIENNAVGTITISGSGTSTGNGIRTFSQTILAAPLSSSASETFMSIYNGQKYRIDQGEETASLWDIGYYYGGTQLASLASAFNYPSNVIDVPAVSGVAAADLNRFYITRSTLNYDDITSGSDLNGIAAQTGERVTDLSVGEVLEFTDQYGNKGVIKVTDLVTGAGTSGKITIAIKVQI